MPTNKQSRGVAAVVLAAGMSRRMGTAKQLLTLGGKMLLQRTLDNVRASHVSEIVLVLGAQAEVIRRQLTLDGIRVVMNPEYQQGIGTSLRRGLAALETAATGALIVLADQPFVRAETLNRLLACHDLSRAQIVIPMFRGFRGNPVLLDRSVFPEVMNLSGDVGCRAIFGDHSDGIHKIEVDDPGILLDIDTNADLRAMESAGEFLAGPVPMPEIESREARQHESARIDLVVVGNDEMARALARLARVLRFNTTFVDPLLKLSDIPEADRILHVLDFSLLPPGRRVVVVASRGHCDEEAVEQALQSGAGYVALLANKKRAQEVITSLRGRGVGTEGLAQVRAPAGLEIGAETPEEIALSILAEIVSTLRHATAPSSRS